VPTVARLHGGRVEDLRYDAMNLSKYRSRLLTFLLLLVGIVLAPTAGIPIFSAFAFTQHQPSSNATVPFITYRSPSTGKHWTTTLPVTGDFAYQTIVGYLRKSGGMGLHPLYDCVIAAYNDHYIAGSQTCDPRFSGPVHLAGFAFDRPPAGLVSVPVYRCYNGGAGGSDDHFDTTNLHCNPVPGYSSEGSQGYILSSRSGSTRSPSPPTLIAQSIYGVSGTFAADYRAGSSTPYSTYPSAYGGCGRTECNGATLISTVANDLHGSYIRFPAILYCFKPRPGRGWWNDSYQGAGNFGSVGDLLWSAKMHGIIPIIDLLPDDSHHGACSKLAGPGTWYNQAVDLVNSEAAVMPSTVYFEIGNEENFNPRLYGGADDAANPFDNYGKYAAIFASAARGLNEALSRNHVRNYRILTGGMLRPTATDDRSRCPSNLVDRKPYALTNYQEAEMAIKAAENPSGPHIPISHLGIAVHPYGYATQSMADWPNYYSLASYNPCSDLQGMLDHWTREPYFKGLPIVFTETNFADTNNTLDSKDRRSRDPYLTDKEAAYLVDSFTWFSRHPTQEHSYARSTGSPSVIVLWFRGNTVQLRLSVGAG